MMMFSNKMLCREISCRQSRICSETKAFLKTEGFYTGIKPYFQIVPKLFESGAFHVCCRSPYRNFIDVPFCFLCRRWLGYLVIGKVVVFASFFCYSFSSFLKTFFRAGVNVIVIFFAADLMIAMLSLFAPSFGDMLPRLDDFPVVFVCQCRGLIKFEYAAVKHAGKFSVLLRLIEKAFSAIPLLSYLTI